MFRRIAIIGGGAAAATLLGELLEHPKQQPLQLDWFTGDGVLARGVAYSTTSEHHLLNVRAASMSMFAGKPRGFLDFVQREDSTISGADFLPRRRYGDYLEAEAARAIAQGTAQGHRVNVLPFAADAVVPESDGVTVLQGENCHRVDAAVLALGALPPQRLAGVSDAAVGSGRYVVDPWPWLSRSDTWRVAPSKVLLIGMGLTAVDVVVELSRRWPQTRFSAISRHGLFPEAHRRTAAPPVDDGSTLVEAMHERPEIRHWVHLLREAVHLDGTDWRPVVDSLRPHIPGLWMDLPVEQRARFLRHARWAWERIRHRIPPPAAQTIAALEQAGRLHRCRGRLRRVELIDQGVQLTTSSGPIHSTHDADLIIQTSGLNTDIRHSEHPLISQLLTNGHIAADPLGLGVLADRDGRLQGGDHHWPHLFAMGSLLRGTLWESTAIPEIRQHARHLADLLLND